MEKKNYYVPLKTFNKSKTCKIDMFLINFLRFYVQNVKTKEIYKKMHIKNKRNVNLKQDLSELNQSNNSRIQE